MCSGDNTIINLSHMKKIPALFFFVIAGLGCLAQQTQHRALLSRIMIARDSFSIPPYSLGKIEQIIASGSHKDSYSALSLREKYTYNMIYGETYSQLCSIPTMYAYADKQIFAFLPMLFFERSWSDRQRAFFKDNRDSVIALMTKDIREKRVVGLNYKHVIVDINAVSLIRLLISTYRLQEDHDILTVLALLMKSNNYKPFMSSFDYKKLYSGTESYYDASLIFNTSNEAFIIQRATDFCNEPFK